ncbi:MAG: hypothetical protein JW748_07590 [Anaerolineales bacterium]|nr:hypothetical protein [Anaerolineales bacterium]
MNIIKTVPVRLSNKVPMAGPSRQGGDICGNQHGVRNAAFQRGDGITAGSSGTFMPDRPPEKFGKTTFPGQKIVEGHVYFVTDVDPIGMTVTVQNPHGPHCPPIKMSFEDYKKCFWLTTSNSVE